MRRFRNTKTSTSAPMLKFRIGCIRWLATSAMIDFSVTVSLVTIVGEMLGKRKKVLPLRHVPEPGGESVNTGGAWAKTDHQTGARRIAQRRLSVRVSKERSASGQFVDVWRLNEWMASHATDPVVLIVYSEEEDVGFVGV